MVRVAALTALASAGLWADTERQLIGAARAGKTELVRDLLGRKPNLNATDKNGKTALIWAAQGGHAAVAQLLLAQGANPYLRDKEGFTAYEVALLDSEGEYAAVLNVLPKPDPLHIDVEGLWLPVNMLSSCVESRLQLASDIKAMAPDEMALNAFSQYERGHAKGAVVVMSLNALGLKAEADIKPQAGAAATVVLAVRPGVFCNNGLDRLSLAIDVTALRGESGPPIFKKTFGGGLTGLHDRPVQSVTEYQKVFEEWVGSHTPDLYWEVLRALLRR